MLLGYCFHFPFQNVYEKEETFEIFMSLLLFEVWRFNLQPPSFCQSQQRIESQLRIILEHWCESCTKQARLRVRVSHRSVNPVEFWCRLKSFYHEKGENFGIS